MVLGGLVVRALVFDTETSGLSKNVTIAEAMRPEIIELYMALVDFGDDTTVVSDLDLLLKPRTRIEEESRSGKVHGITNEMVRQAPAFAEVLPKVKVMIEAAPMVIAHNASFDVEMIDIEANRCHQQIEWPRVLCTVEATAYLKGHRLTLGDLHDYLFKEKFEGSHRAKVDVSALIRCVAELFKRGML